MKNGDSPSEDHEEPFSFERELERASDLWDEQEILEDTNDLVLELEDIRSKFFLGKFFVTDENEDEDIMKLLEEDFKDYLSERMPDFYKEIKEKKTPLINVYRSMLQYEMRRLPLKAKKEDAVEYALSLRVCDPHHPYLGHVDLDGTNITIKDLKGLELLAETTGKSAFKKRIDQSIEDYALDVFISVADNELNRLSEEKVYGNRRVSVVQTIPSEKPKPL